MCTAHTGIELTHRVNKTWNIACRPGTPQDLLGIFPFSLRRRRQLSPPPPPQAVHRKVTPKTDPTTRVHNNQRTPQNKERNNKWRIDRETCWPPSSQRTRDIFRSSLFNDEDDGSGIGRAKTAKWAVNRPITLGYCGG